ncbi:peptidoglycan-binding protein [Streptomyces sp. NPDC054962]
MRKSRRNVVLGVLAVCLVGGTATVLQLQAGDADAAPDGSALPPATAPIQRGDLSATTQADGTLGHLGKRTVNAGAAGTLTWIAPAGSLVKRDGRLFEVDGRAVRLMYGSKPMYRNLKDGTKGEDVRQFETNLAALGYVGFTPDEEYTDLTAKAVKRWQKSAGFKETGAVGPEEVVFSAGALRINDHKAAVGDRSVPGQPVLTGTGSERIVTFRLTPEEALLAEKKAKLSIVLPGGKTVGGRVLSVGKTATPGSDPQDKTPKVTVTGIFDDGADKSGFDQATVSVEVRGETRTNVLSVPVNALMALSEGGFGVQVVSGNQVKDVKVELGLFADGRVEIRGPNLREGLKVGVPKV